MLRQAVYKLVDFGFGVVEVRTGAQTTAALGDHDAVLGFEMLSHLLVIVHVRDERDDTARLGRNT